MTTIAEIQKFRKELFNELRAELGHLKGCQTSLLIFSAAGAGLFLGLLRTDTYLSPMYALLLPLIFLLPLWLIFYEKARSVARIVGFVRVQEACFEYSSELAFIGWESAMKRYWQRREVWNDRLLDGEFTTDEPKTVTTSVYWFTVYCTFLIFSSLCLLGGFVHLPIPPGAKAIKAIIVVSLLITFIQSFHFLQWHRIGKTKKRFSFEEVDVRIPHTNMKVFAVRARNLAFCFSFIFALIFTFGLLGEWIPMADLLTEWTWVAIVVYLIFMCAAIFCTSMASWMLLNLVKSRYSYDTFEVRWQIILNIKIDRKNKEILDIDWEKRIEELKKPKAIDMPPGDPVIKVGNSEVSSPTVRF